MPGKRGGLARYAFHHAAISGEGVNVVADHLVARTVEILCHPLAGNRHADAGRHPLAQRASGRLDARGPAVFRMAGALAVELAEALDALKLYRKLSQGFVFGIHRFYAG